MCVTNSWVSDIEKKTLFRAAKEVFKLDECIGVDLSEDMLRVAEHLEGIKRKTGRERVLS